MISELIIATRNTHKAKEIAAMLPACRVRTLADFPDLPEVEENGHSFAENAALKAQQISARVDGTVLADDSGLCVEALSGMPGVLSARYAGEHGNDDANNRKLLAELAVLPVLAPFRAKFVCAMCLARSGQVLANFTGCLSGRITLSPRGANGFGYDPLFVPDGFSCTLAELPAEQKNAISHRFKALNQVVDYLDAAGGILPAPQDPRATAGASQRRQS